MHTWVNYGPPFCVTTAEGLALQYAMPYPRWLKIFRQQKPLGDEHFGGRDALTWHSPHRRVPFGSRRPSRWGRNLLPSARKAHRACARLVDRDRTRTASDADTRAVVCRLIREPIHAGHPGDITCAAYGELPSLWTDSVPILSAVLLRRPSLELIVMSIGGHLDRLGGQ